MAGRRETLGSSACRRKCNAVPWAVNRIAMIPLRDACSVPTQVMKGIDGEAQRLLGIRPS